MKFLQHENFEVTGYYQTYVEGCIPVPDNYRVTQRIIHPFDPNYSQVGTIFTEEEVSKLVSDYLDMVERQQMIKDEIQSLIGRNILSFTDGERWKLLAALLFKAGVMNSNGIVLPYSDWLDI